MVTETQAPSFEHTVEISKNFERGPDWESLKSRYCFDCTPLSGIFRRRSSGDAQCWSCGRSRSVSMQRPAPAM